MTVGSARTGDFKNNLERLRSHLKSVHYNGNFDIEALISGKTQVYLPLLDYVFTGSSKLLAKYLVYRGYELYNKTDQKFVDSMCELK
jgi:hypothetical protein